MREILFRGFHECEDGDTTIFVDGREVRGRWVKGAYSSYNWTFSGKREIKPQIIIFADNENDGLWVEVLPSTVGQYTGLTDKNGRKIFEGDIIKEIYRRLDGRIESSVYDVAWNDFSVGFHLIIETERAETTTYLTKNGMYEVIGTIFDNAQEVAK